MTIWRNILYIFVFHRYPAGQLMRGVASIVNAQWHRKEAFVWRCYFQTSPNIIIEVDIWILDIKLVDEEAAFTAIALSNVGGNICWTTCFFFICIWHLFLVFDIWGEYLLDRLYFVFVFSICIWYLGRIFVGPHSCQHSPIFSNSCSSAAKNTNTSIRVDDEFWWIIVHRQNVKCLYSFHFLSLQCSYNSWVTFKSRFSFCSLLCNFLWKVFPT